MTSLLHRWLILVNDEWYRTHLRATFGPIVSLLPTMTAIPMSAKVFRILGLASKILIRFMVVCVLRKLVTATGTGRFSEGARKIEKLLKSQT
ncbi:hypothetical protein PanWU01x14_073790 [Parasponia andersonii]|uniref:Uncharacterized protein n=1 Tax=Parasponia andersonii TaxID=3476 RepID=A0A2P5DD71_PARAD|nr:hypothetical protein PanWU01x14_073790 [Parasponia andersonii]